MGVHYCEKFGKYIVRGVESEERVTSTVGEKRMERRDLKVDKGESAGGLVGETNIIICWVFSKGYRRSAMS